jgi:hypothetical protein
MSFIMWVEMKVYVDVPNEIYFHVKANFKHKKTQNKSVASITIMISTLGKIFHKSFNIVIMILKRTI